jgi:hypothetical protein
MKIKLNKKRKVLLVILLVFIVFLSSYIAMASYNYVPFPGLNSTIQYPDSKSIAKMSIKKLFLELDLNSNFSNDFGELENMSIELELFGIENNNAEDIFSWYKSEYLKQGWELYKSFNDNGNNLKVYYGIWTKGIMIQATVVAEGIILKNYIGYDIISGSALTDMISFSL